MNGSSLFPVLLDGRVHTRCGALALNAFFRKLHDVRGGECLDRGDSLLLEQFPD
jgi:hypothetical protein